MANRGPQGEFTLEKTEGYAISLPERLNKACRNDIEHSPAEHGIGYRAAVRDTRLDRREWTEVAASDEIRFRSTTPSETTSKGPPSRPSERHAGPHE